jgi:uncharacterized protein (DUF427 family)
MDNEHDRLQREQKGWRWNGDERPPFAAPCGPGQESVWDYPRPPRIEEDPREVIVRFEGVQVARTLRTLRLLETASPPTFYIPRDDIDVSVLKQERGTSYCEWKGEASYVSVVIPGLRKLNSCGWSYLKPTKTYEALQGHVAFYPHELECTVAGIRVQPQEGQFYGGWITPELTGPFKGAHGSSGW